MGSGNLEPLVGKAGAAATGGAMPVINLRPVTAAPAPPPGGGGRVVDQGAFECPVYPTVRRGAAAFTASLRTRAAHAKWALAGVALLLEYP